MTRGPMALRRASYCAEPGDSGATVYLSAQRTRVAGVHSGDANGSNECPPGASDESVYAHADFVNNALDVNIKVD